MTAMDPTGRAVVVTTATTTTTTTTTITTTLAATTGILVLDATVRNKVTILTVSRSDSQQSRLVIFSGIARRTLWAGTSGHANKKPDASGRVFALTQGHAAKLSDSARITHVYGDLPLQFDDKIHLVNALPLDMCEFDMILGIDWYLEEIGPERVCNPETKLEDLVRLNSPEDKKVEQEQKGLGYKAAVEIAWINWMVKETGARS
ncbi:hypothetical protein Tco_0491109 [Tanacetum coccineum]